jgi:cytochrome c peroxidase
MDSVKILSLVAIISVSAAISHADELNRSPLALSALQGTVCLTANHTGRSISLVDVASGKVLQELVVGNGPADIVWIDESTAIVSLLHDDAIAVVSRDKDRLDLVRTIPVGDEPRGLALSQDRKTVYVALGGDDAVAQVDLASSSVVTKLPAAGIPKTVRISPDGRMLVTSTAVPATIYVHDLESKQLISERRLFDGAFNPGVPVISEDSKLLVIPHAVNREFAVTPQMIDIGWVIDNRISKLPLPDGEPSSQKQLGLDIRGKAVGDAYAALFTSDESRLVVSCGGTHELLVIDFSSIPWPTGDPGDFLPAAMQKDASKFRRIKVGGRPMGMTLLDDQTVVVANYLLNCLQVVDLNSGDITKTISLGGPAEPDLARQGEIVFYDADRSMHSWFSCHTCHTEGHTAGQVFDTRNDRSFGTPKLTPSLRGVAETGPWTWHGWQTDLHDAMKRSLTESMATKHPITDEDATAMVAYLKTLGHPVNPRATSADTALTQKQELGRTLFSGKAGCASCHGGSQFTSGDTFDGKVEDRKDRDNKYNPPTLRGVASRRRYLHTGKARSLEAVLTKYHRPEDLVGESLTDEERDAVIEYLKSL